MKTLERPSIRTKSLPLPDVSLAESREKYRALFESNMIGIVLSDLDETLLEANDAFLDLIGYTREDFLAGRITWSKITPPDEFAGIDRKKVREVLRRGSITPFEKRYIRKDGREVPVLVGAARVRVEPPLSVCFALDISERKNLERKKDEFIGTVSHELQTPLAVLKMQIGLLRAEIADAHEPLSPAKFERAIDEIDDQVSRLSVLITDLLNLARYTGDPHPSREAFDIGACAEKVVADARLISRRRIVFKKWRTACFVTGSERHIARVITNLLMNAIRYSPEMSRIIVSIQPDGKKIRVNVQDFGAGIEPENIHKIFERFYRIERAGSRTRGSSGIGLYVAQEIAKNNGGVIEVESTPGKGSTFSLVLPLTSREA